VGSLTPAPESDLRDDSSRLPLDRGGRQMSTFSARGCSFEARVRALDPTWDRDAGDAVILVADDLGWDPPTRTPG